MKFATTACATCFTMEVVSRAVVEGDTAGTRVGPDAAGVLTGDRFRRGLAGSDARRSGDRYSDDSHKPNNQYSDGVRICVHQ